MFTLTCSCATFSIFSSSSLDSLPLGYASHFLFLLQILNSNHEKGKFGSWETVGRLMMTCGIVFFQSQQSDVTSYLEENKVPVPFLVMVILQFALIVIDRALYLRKYILGKFFYQMFLVTFIHIAMFFILPAVTERYAGFSSRNSFPQTSIINECLHSTLTGSSMPKSLRRCGTWSRLAFFNYYY